MMEFEYSPRHSPGNAAHLLSPVHAHGTSMDGFTTIQQIRRSLSRSPSKPARYSIQSARAAAAVSPSEPNSPVGYPRATNLCPATDPIVRPKYSVKRNGVVRTASRRTSPNSPLRRALTDNASQANAKPHINRKPSVGDQENMDCTPDGSEFAPDCRFDEAIKIDFLKPDSRLQPIRKGSTSPVKSSPLKRSDGVMNLEAATFTNSRNKRRSLHGPGEFNIFDQGLDGTQSDSADSSEEKECQYNTSQVYTASTPAASSPQRRPPSLRKSTLQQRTGPARPKHTDAPKEPALSPSLTRARSRISLDSALPLRSFDVESPFRRGNANDPPIVFPAPAQKLYQSAPKPHPLSHALTLSSSSSMMEDYTQASQVSTVPSFHGSEAPKLPSSFSKSLPIGAMRPSPDEATDASQRSSQESFATPDGYRMAKPLPQAFMSTGLISKRNRNLDMPSNDLFSSVHMPDTPSKKAHVLFPSSPAPPSALGGVSHPTHAFGSPSTPFNARTSKVSTESFGKGMNIFGARLDAQQPSRRSSFLGVEEDVNNSPTHQLQSQSSNDDLPPTPTKSTSTTTRPQSKGKNNSLRSSLFGRRASLGPDTFAAPTEAEVATECRTDCKYLFLAEPPGEEKEEIQPSIDDSSTPFITLTASTPPSPFDRSLPLQYERNVRTPSPLARRSLRSAPLLEYHDSVHTKSLVFTASSPINEEEITRKPSPHTPHGFCNPPDPSSLSISAERRQPTGLASSISFPPATPTGPREQYFNGSLGLAHASSSYFSNDVDTSITSRFSQVTALGVGEFSQVYKVENPVARGASYSPRVSSPAGGVWAVKKSRKPYAGNKDRQRKMREVQILKALRGHEHVIEFVDEWESKHHLYIQTEFCENGNLMGFLIQTGFKGRLDDFRIWKILLELSQGVKSIHDANFIHLDLKPANVFIDWEGVLKIGDFGLASSWPAPAGLDGEGDREYIGPEVLSGRFDKPADIFSLGMVMLEIAGNIILPDNGTSWQRLRAGDMSDLPSLTWSSDSSLVRDDSGDPIELMNTRSNDSLCISNPGDDDLSFLKPAVPKLQRSGDLEKPPNFMVDPNHPEALDGVVQWMICPDPDQRPTIDQLLAAGGVQWVERRRRAGATVYEGNWGPANDVLNHEQDVEMVDI